MNRFSFLFIFLLSNSSLGSECDVGICAQTQTGIKLPSVSELERPLEWFSVNEQGLLHSGCKSPGPLTNQEMINEIEELVAPTASQNFKVHGVYFEKESWKLVRAFRELTTAFSPGEQINFQAKFSINPECKKVKCAVEKIWGNTLGPKLLYLKLKHNFNSSEYAFPESMRFDEELIDDVLSVLSDFPEHLLPFEKSNQRLSLMSRDVFSMNFADSSIKFYSKWQAASSSARQAIVFHEFAHNISTRLKNMDQSPDWLSLSGWEKKDESWSKNKEACFLSGYSFTTPAEDYAESLSAYRYQARLLKKKCPEKYSFIKAKVFRGIEYDSHESCARISSLELRTFVHELSPLIFQIQEKKMTDQDVIRLCSDLLIFNSEEETNKECYGRFLKEKISAFDQSKIENALVKSGVKSNSKIKALMLNRTIESLLRTPSPQDLAQVKSLPPAINGIIDKIALLGQPKILRLQVNFGVSCLKELISKDIKRIRTCAMQEILKNDQKYRTWGAGNAFPPLDYPRPWSESSRRAIEDRRDQIFSSTMLENQLLDKQIKEISEQVKSDIKNKFKVAESEIEKTHVDYKKMGPKDFCSTFYTANYFSLPDFKLWCEVEQGNKKERFIFSTKEKARWLPD